MPADPGLLMMLPFAVLLVAIACAPVVLRHHWERHYHEISAGLGAVTIGYYLLVLREPWRVGHVCHEYLSFMAFVGALYVVAGGMDIEIRGPATPVRNTLYLVIGALLANVIGTTGAAILLIRPWIGMNRGRMAAYHLVFFIFIVANAGGCLTPVANPPLFLGFIKGVPFGWVAWHCWPAWLLVNGVLLGEFLIFDTVNFRRKRSPDEARISQAPRIRGLASVPCFAAIIGALLLPPWIREGAMIAAAAVSCAVTPKWLRRETGFTFTPLKEVAWLFAGIFATMIAPLDYLTLHAGELGIRAPMHFYWLSGGLSAILDNAPTYLAFAAAAFGLHGLNLDVPADVAGFAAHEPVYLMAISLGSVFFGAMTYLGNGPNLILKSIAEKEGVPVPNFLEYVWRYALPILLPVLVLVSVLFFG